MHMRNSVAPVAQRLNLRRASPCGSGGEFIVQTKRSSSVRRRKPLQCLASGIDADDEVPLSCTDVRTVGSLRPGETVSHTGSILVRAEAINS